MIDDEESNEGFKSDIVKRLRKIAFAKGVEDDDKIVDLFHKSTRRKFPKEVIHEWLDEETLPDPEFLYDISEAFDVDFKWLVPLHEYYDAIDDHDEEPDEDVPALYVNGTSVTLTSNDILIRLGRNRKKVLEINLPHSTALTLAFDLNNAIELYEKATGIDVPTDEELGELLQQLVDASTD